MGGSRRGVPSLLGCLLEGVGEKYGSHQVLDGTATKATTSARGGRRHSPKQNPCWKVQAAKNAEAGKKTTTPRSLPASSHFRFAGVAVPPKSSLLSDKTGLQLPAILVEASRAPPTAPRMLQASPACFPSAPARQLARSLISVCAASLCVALCSKDGLDVF